MLLLNQRSISRSPWPQIYHATRPTFILHSLSGSLWPCPLTPMRHAAAACVLLLRDDAAVITVTLLSLAVNTPLTDLTSFRINMSLHDLGPCLASWSYDYQSRPYDHACPSSSPSRTVLIFQPCHLITRVLVYHNCSLFDLDLALCNLTFVIQPCQRPCPSLTAVTIRQQNVDLISRH